MHRPLISGDMIKSPRTQLLIGDTSAEFPNGDGDTLVGGVITNLNGTLWKLLVGAADKLHTVSQNVRFIHTHSLSFLIHFYTTTYIRSSLVQDGPTQVLILFLWSILERVDDIPQMDVCLT